ncbi:10407_t:CDS:2, partial [Gigaspora margarita]
NSIEHSIYFNNNDANNNISTALAELDDTFFVENSSSESDQNISDNKIKSESDNNKNFDNNSNITYLSNFEYIDNPNNYIEDRVYDDLKLKENAHVVLNVWKKLDMNSFLQCRIEFESLDKNIYDMVIKGQLIAFQKDENKNKVTATDKKYI